MPALGTLAAALGLELQGVAECRVAQSRVVFYSSSSRVRKALSDRVVMT